MAQVPLEVRITVDSAAVKKALRGIAKESIRTEKAAQKEIDKTKAARTTANRKAITEIKGLERAFQQMGQRAGRELSESIFTGVKNGRRKAMAFLKRNRMGIAKGAGAVAVGAGFAGRQAFQTARAITGAPTLTENIGSAKDFDRRMTLLQNQSQMSDAQMASLQQRLVTQGSEGTLSPSQLLAGVEAVQRLEGADAIPAYLDSMGRLSEFSEGLGANFEDLSKLSTILQRQFGITAKEMPETIGLIAEAGVMGSVEIENFARQFPRVMGVFSSLLNRSGREGVREFAAVAQAGATMFPDSPEQSSRAMRSFINQLSTSKTASILKSRGLDPQTTPIPEIARSLSITPLTAKQMEKAFPNDLAKALMIALVKQFDEGVDNVMTSVMDANGMGQLNRAQMNTGRVRADATGQDQIRRNQMQANMIGSFDAVASSSLKLTESIDMWVSKFPGEVVLAKMGADFLTSALTIAAMAKFLGGGTAAKKGVDAVKTIATGVGAGGGAGAAVKTGLRATGAVGLVAGGIVGQRYLRDQAFAEMMSDPVYADSPMNPANQDPNARPRIDLQRIFGFGDKGGVANAAKDLQDAAKETKLAARANHRAATRLDTAAGNVGKQEGD